MEEERGGEYRAEAPRCAAPGSRGEGRNGREPRCGDGAEVTAVLRLARGGCVERRCEDVGGRRDGAERCVPAARGGG